MALIQCPECKESINGAVKNCPKCGYKLKEPKNFIKKYKALFISVGIIVLGVAGILLIGLIQDVIAIIKHENLVRNDAEAPVIECTESVEIDKYDDFDIEAYVKANAVVSDNVTENVAIIFADDFNPQQFNSQLSQMPYTNDCIVTLRASDEAGNVAEHTLTVKVQVKYTADQADALINVIAACNALPAALSDPTTLKIKNIRYGFDGTTVAIEFTANNSIDAEANRYAISVPGRMFIGDYASILYSNFKSAHTLTYDELRAFSESPYNKSGVKLNV